MLSHFGLHSFRDVEVQFSFLILSHRNIAKLFQVIETTTTIFMVIEYCPGGELFDYIVAKNKLPEDEARVFFRQIVAAVG